MLRVKWGMDMKRLALLVPAALAILPCLPASSEPYLNRDAATLAPGRFIVQADGFWGASRGAFDSDRGEVELAATPGSALVRGAGLEARAGLPGALELSVRGGYSVQEIKVDRWDSVSGWAGSDVSKGEGPDDIEVALKWSVPAVRWLPALAVEAGARAPLARGPDRARHFYDRRGNGSWGFPVGARFTGDGSGPVTAYGSAFWEPSLKRSVTRWNGTEFDGPHGFVPGEESSFSAGVEVAGNGFRWAIELHESVAGRDGGAAVDALRAAGREGETWPEMESLELVPSVSLGGDRISSLHLALFIPLGGRNIYRVLAVGGAVRVGL